MEILVKGDTQSLIDNRQHVLGTLAESIEDAFPDAAEALRKAAPIQSATFEHGVLEHLHDQQVDAYAKMLDAMQTDIVRVLRRGTLAAQKSMTDDST